MATDEKNIQLLIQQCLDEAKKKVKSLKKLNIMVIGKTGAGKSTLVNALFGKKIAEVAIGHPVTQLIQKQDIANYPLVIYDTPGLELNQQQQQDLKQEVRKTIIESYGHRNVNDFVHCILYCINVAATRVDTAELQWIRELTQENSDTKVPVIVVLTQAYFSQDAKALEDVISKENLGVQIVKVVAQTKHDDDVIIPARGLGTLLKTMMELLPEDIQKTLAYVQVADVEMKRREAQAMINGIIAGSVALSAVPIPLSDVAILVGASASILLSISTIYGKTVSKRYVVEVVSAVIGAVGTGIVNLLIPSALKLIPGGIIPAEAVSAVLVGGFIEVLGQISMKLMEMQFESETELKTLSKEDKQFITRRVKQKLRANRA